MRKMNIHFIRGKEENLSCFSVNDIVEFYLLRACNAYSLVSI